jgi:hypothetical protein
MARWQVPRRKRKKPSNYILTIPQVRERLYELSDQWRIPELRWLADATIRRTLTHKARAQQKKITPDVVLDVRAFVEDHPRTHQRKVGRIFGIDGGRVHEILHGYRDGRRYGEDGVLHGIEK